MSKTDEQIEMYEKTLIISLLTVWLAYAKCKMNVIIYTRHGRRNEEKWWCSAHLNISVMFDMADDVHERAIPTQRDIYIAHCVHCKRKSR